MRPEAGASRLDADPAAGIASGVVLLRRKSMNLALAPAPYLQALFEAVQLAIIVHDDGEHATITIKLPADQLPEITHVAETNTDVTPSHELPREAAPELVGMLSVPPVRFELTLDGF